jgi:glucosyl-dolichyl phosphate glucuronosyltransferase
MSNFILTIAICTHNRPDDTAECLDSLYTQDLTGIQLLVVDSGSGHDAHRALMQIVANRASLQLIRLEPPGLSLARNAALAAAEAPWIAYLDDDAVAASDWVAEAKRLIAEAPPICPAISGQIELLFPPGVNPKAGPRWRQFLGEIKQEGEGNHLHGVKMGCGNAIFRCDTLIAMGCFPEALGRVGNVLLSGEEKLVGERLCEAGWHVLHSNRLRIGHKVSKERLTRKWAAKRAYWDGITDLKIQRLMRRPVGIRYLARLAAVIPVLALLIPNQSLAQEFFIRFWYNVGTVRELVFPVRLRSRLPPMALEAGRTDRRGRTCFGSLNGQMPSRK